MATINTWIHWFADCTDFPVGVNDKVKAKMSTSSRHKITCPRCSERLAEDAEQNLARGAVKSD